MLRNKIHHFIFNLHNVKPKAGYIDATMSWKEFIEATKKENPQEPYMVISEDGIDIFYINSPIGCYRVTLTKENKTEC